MIKRQSGVISASRERWAPSCSSFPHLTGITSLYQSWGGDITAPFCRNNFSGLLFFKTLANLQISKSLKTILRRTFWLLMRKCILVLNSSTASSQISKDAQQILLEWLQNKYVWQWKPDCAFMYQKSCFVLNYIRLHIYLHVFCYRYKSCCHFSLPLTIYWLWPLCLTAKCGNYDIHTDMQQSSARIITHKQ